MRNVILTALLLLGPVATAGAQEEVPPARWDHREDSEDWSRAAIDALKEHGSDLVETTPEDIGRWCPNYATAEDGDRRAFWVGFLSTLAQFESTWRADAVGGGGKWYGLLQILPATARQYGCRAQSGNALLDGAANLSCAIRIMAETVPRDGAIRGDGAEGVAADWAPLRVPAKREDMRDWVRGQDYCRMDESLRPKPRPERDLARRDTVDPTE